MVTFTGWGVDPRYVHTYLMYASLESTICQKYFDWNIEHWVPNSTFSSSCFCQTSLLVKPTCCRQHNSQVHHAVLVTSRCEMTSLRQFWSVIGFFAPGWYGWTESHKRWGTWQPAKFQTLKRSWISMVSLFFLKCSFSRSKIIAIVCCKQLFVTKLFYHFVAFLCGVKNSLHQADSLQVPLVPLFREGDTLLKAWPSLPMCFYCYYCYDGY